MGHRIVQSIFLLSLGLCFSSQATALENPATELLKATYTERCANISDCLFALKSNWRTCTESLDYSRYLAAEEQSFEEAQEFNQIDDQIVFCLNQKSSARFFSNENDKRFNRIIDPELSAQARVLVLTYLTKAKDKKLNQDEFLSFAIPKVKTYYLNDPSKFDRVFKNFIEAASRGIQSFEVHAPDFLINISGSYLTTVPYEANLVSKQASKKTLSSYFVVLITDGGAHAYLQDGAKLNHQHYQELFPGYKGGLHLQSLVVN